MKKIKFLNKLVILLIVLYSLTHVLGIYNVLPAFGYGTLNGFFNFLLFTNFILTLDFFFTLIFFIGLIYVHRGLLSIIKDGVFNIKTKEKFKRGGILFLVSGTLSFLLGLSLLVNDNFQDDYFILILIFLGKEFFVLVTGFSLYALTDIIDNGLVLKQENDLTV